MFVFNWFADVAAYIAQEPPSQPPPGLRDQLLLASSLHAYPDHYH